MPTHTLDVPRWVDVVLEGRGVQLERAFAEYGRLSTLLSAREWELHAPEVHALALGIAERELAVRQSEDVARQRAQVQPDFTAGVDLADQVRRRRGKLAECLKTSPDQLCTALDMLAQDAHESTVVARAWKLYVAERAIWTVGSLLMLVAGPVASFFVATSQGGVRFDLAGLVDTGAPVAAMVGAGTVAVLCQFRLVSWEWLSKRKAPGWALTAFLCGVVLLGGVPVHALQTSTMGALVFASSALLGLRALLPWWRRIPH